MTNEEMKKKIMDIVLNVAWEGYLGNTYHFSGGRSAANAIADALIAAGIGDVKEAEMERKAYEVAASQYRIEFETQKYWREVAEHRAEVAENELKLYKLAVKIWQERYSDIRCFNFNIALRQAEKELAEEGKDD